MARPKTPIQYRAIEYLQRYKKPRPKKYYRCGQCRTRRVLRREIWQYERIPPCRCCRQVDWIIDMHRTRDWLKKQGAYERCECDGMWYIHKPGSVPLCIHNLAKLTDVA